ncbi:MAG: glycosyl transferase family 2 [Deltaproteobacteria bacterium RIFOXYD12_FULL_50_9]|nr:MAG: glycosyl transferase family 2 [Deltaproteobacteria bacterium RIFOXYD12_FULL_50_9]
MVKTTISAIIITKNEAVNIRKCLESLAWVDEIVVVDSGSTDETIAICREFTEKVYSHDWPGFGPQKNRALQYAVGEWVLSIDADERVSVPLREEISSVLLQPGRDAYEMPRLSSYCGRFIRHSGWRPDYVLRLFRRQRGRFSDNIVHERVLVDGPVGKLKNDLIHYSFRDLEQVLNVVNRYSSLGAEQKFKAGQRGGLGLAILHGLGNFLSTYFLQAGFLDGRQGLMLAISNAEGTYYKFLKLLYLGEKNPHDRD